MDRIDGGVQLRLARRNHSGNGSQEHHAGRQQTNFADLPDVGRSGMAAKHLAQVLLDILLPIDWTSVEAHHVAVPAEAPGELAGIARVPAAENLIVQCADLALGCGGGSVIEGLIRHDLLGGNQC